MSATARRVGIRTVLGTGVLALASGCGEDSGVPTPAVEASSSHEQAALVSGGHLEALQQHVLGLARANELLERLLDGEDLEQVEAGLREVTYETLPAIQRRWDATGGPSQEVMNRSDFAKLELALMGERNRLVSIKRQLGSRLEGNEVLAGLVAELEGLQDLIRDPY